MPGLGGRSAVIKRGCSTKPLPADLAGLIPTLEDLGLGSGDNGTSPPPSFSNQNADGSPRSNVRRSGLFSSPKPSCQSGTYHDKSQKLT
jgi:hypothetical protein